MSKILIQELNVEKWYLIDPDLIISIEDMGEYSTIMYNRVPAESSDFSNEVFKLDTALSIAGIMRKLSVSRG